VAWQGKARLGMARQGWHGMAGLGSAGQGGARQARQVLAGLGVAGQGVVWLAIRLVCCSNA